MAKGRARIVVRLLACVGLLLGVELAVRAALPHQASRDFFLTLFGDPPDATPPARAPLFEGDPELFWRLRPGIDTIWDFTVVSTNEQGLRHPRPIEPKRTGALRVVCVGDSVTFGYRVPLVFAARPAEYDREDAPYPERLQRLLAARYPGRDVEVIALAVPGYSTFQGRLLLARSIGWLEPDVVVICFGFNDVVLNHAADEELMTQDWLGVALRTVTSSSQALLHAFHWWTSRGAESDAPAPPPAKPVPRVSRQDYLNNIEGMIALSGAHGAEVLVVGPVYRDAMTNPPEAARLRLYRATLRAAMLAVGVPYLQVPELTEAAYPDNEELFGERIHPSSRGHRLLAERVFEALREHGMLPPLDAEGS